jgi:uncharacterized protein (DUF1697 family)
LKIPYIALLRGINVSGKKPIKMEALRLAIAELPLENISTYIQSGNVIFKSEEEDKRKLEKQIADKVFARFGFDISVFVFEPSELRNAVGQNPYKAKTTVDSVQPYVGFMSDIPNSTAVSLLRKTDFKGDEFVVTGKTIFLWYAQSAGDTKLTNALIEKKFGLRSTFRNWKTINKLIELSNGL